VATTERPDLADMRQITGEVSSVPILIYTIDNSVPVNTITDDTVVFKLPMDVSSLSLSCTASTGLLSADGKHMLANNGYDHMQQFSITPSIRKIRNLSSIND